MKNRFSPLLLPTLAALLLGLTGCDRAAPEASALPPKVEGESIVFPAGDTKLAFLTSVTLTTQPSASLHLNGRLTWNEDRTVRVYSPFAGRVARIYVKPGDTVKKGQPLALVSSPDFGQAQADARRAETDFALANKNLARMKELESHGVAPRKDLQAAEADYARAEAELARTRARLKLYGAGGDSVNQVYTLASPIAGTVVERNINPGQEVRPDQMVSNAPALFVVTNPDHLWVLLDAGEEDLDSLNIGKLFVVRSPAYRDLDFPATITAISDFVDPTTRTIKVRASLNNSSHKLKAEMFITAEIDARKTAQLQLPAKAVFFQAGKQYVFIDDGNGKYTRQEVLIGDESQGAVEVLSGLSDGQRVVTEGTLMLQQMLQPRRVQN